MNAYPDSTVPTRRRRPFCGCLTPEQVRFFCLFFKFPIRSAKTLNIALPALFLPYRLAQRADVSSGSEDEWGILEVQSVSPPNQRSWFFMEGEVISGKLCESLCREVECGLHRRRMTDGKLLVMTPIDPAFLLIPILQAIKPVGKELDLDHAYLRFAPE